MVKHVDCTPVRYAPVAVANLFEPKIQIGDSKAAL